MKNSIQTLNMIVAISFFPFISCQKEDGQENEIKEADIAIYAGSTIGYKDGPVSSSQFTYPNLITKGPENSLYIVEDSNYQREINRGLYGSVAFGGNRIRKITSNGMVSTILDLGIISESNRILGIAVNRNGDVHFSQANQIKRIEMSGEISLVAGDGSSDIMRDGPALKSTFWQPMGLAFDRNDCLYIMDSRNNAVRILSNNRVSTLAGGNREFDPTIEPGYWGPKDGNGRQAEFDYPKQISVDDSLNVYVVGGYHRIVRRISKLGDVTTMFDVTGDYDTDHLDTYIGVSSPYKNSLYVSGIFNDYFGLDWGYDLQQFSLSNGTKTSLATDIFNAEGYDQFPEKPLPIELRSFAGLTIAKDTLYVCNTVNHQILRMGLN